MIDCTVISGARLARGGGTPARRRPVAKTLTPQPVFPKIPKSINIKLLVGPTPVSDCNIITIACAYYRCYYLPVNLTDLIKVELTAKHVWQLLHLAEQSERAYNRVAANAGLAEETYEPLQDAIVTVRALRAALQRDVVGKALDGIERSTGDSHES